MTTPHSPYGDGSGRPVSDSYRNALHRFWANNIKLMLSLLFVWAIAGLGCGILFAEKLNEFRLGGYPLGFWFAQQGSIVVFVLLILTYCLLMNRLEKKHHTDLEQDESQSGGGI